MAAYKANDKFRATLRSTWVSDPADSTIAVNAIPTNVPTIVVVGWETQYETVFSVTATSGDNSSNYSLTGVTKIKGYEGNLPEGSAVNCLNNEEFFNQYEDLISGLEEDVTAVEEALPTGDVVGTTDEQTLTNKTLLATTNVVEQTTTTTSSATPTPTGGSLRNFFTITALGEAAEFAAPSGTPANGNVLIIRIKDDATGRALTYNAIYRAVGITLPTTTTASKTTYIGAKYNSADSKWDCIATGTEA
jgi:hypothetical protein